MGSNDWRVQLGQHLVDAVIAIGVLILIALKPDFTGIGVAILGPIVGARAAASKAGKPGDPSQLAPVVGGAVALVAFAGALFARSRGVAVMLLALVGFGFGSAACTRAQRGAAIVVAGDECVLIQDPMGRALCVGAEQIAILINDIAARKAAAGETAVASAASTTTTSAASAVPTTAASAAGSR